MNKLSRYIFAFGLATGVSSVNAGDWQYGFGVGLGAMDVDGDGGFNTALLGPVEFDASLSPGDIMDYMDSAINLGGFARNEDLTISFGYAALDLKEDVSAQKGNIDGKLDLKFSTVVASVIADYVVAKSGSTSWGVVGGVRYSDQEFDATLMINGNKEFDGNVKDDWVDAVLGVSHSYAFSPTLVWTNQVDYGFGGSDGTLHFNTGIGKVFGSSWLVKAALDIKTVDYEQGSKGDSDWYLYDATETSLGVSVLYLF